MSDKACRLLKKYAALHQPEGSQFRAVQQKNGNVTVQYNGFMQFYKALKKMYKQRKLTLDEIKTELKNAGVC